MSAPSADNVDLLALDPASVTTDGQSSTARSAEDTIRLANYARLIGARNGPRRGIRFSTMIPSGPVGRVVGGLAGYGPFGGCGGFDGGCG